LRQSSKSNLVHRAPHPVLFAGNFNGNLVKVLFVSGAGQPPSDPVGERLAELQGPLPHSLVADDDAARGQHLLDHAPPISTMTEALSRLLALNLELLKSAIRVEWVDEL
jgi:hypothetical protein